MIVARYYRRDPAVKVGPANCIHKHANIYKYFFQFKEQIKLRRKKIGRLSLL